MAILLLVPKTTAETELFTFVVEVKEASGRYRIRDSLAGRRDFLPVFYKIMEMIVVFPSQETKEKFLAEYGEDYSVLYRDINKFMEELRERGLFFYFRFGSEEGDE